LIRQGLRGGSGPQRWIRALGEETGNPIMACASLNFVLRVLFTKRKTTNKGPMARWLCVCLVLMSAHGCGALAHVAGFAVAGGTRGDLFAGRRHAGLAAPVRPAVRPARLGPILAAASPLAVWRWAMSERASDGNSTRTAATLEVAVESQLQGYEGAAMVWVIGAGLHMLAFSLLNPASWTTRAMFALAYSHFLLFLLSVRAQCVAVSRGLLEAEVHQQLNLALAFSALLAAFISVTKFLLQGVVEVAVPATALVASALTTVVSLSTWQVRGGKPAGRQADARIQHLELYIFSEPECMHACVFAGGRELVHVNAH